MLLQVDTMKEWCFERCGESVIVYVCVHVVPGKCDRCVACSQPSHSAELIVVQIFCCIKSV